MAFIDTVEPSFTVPADSGKSRELPPGVWREVLLHLTVQERFVACMVCKAWRSHALSMLIPDLEVCLNSGAAADGFKAWLAAHSRQLASLTVTEFYFSHHGFSAPAAGAAMRSRLGQVARVKLWQGLHGGGHALQHLHTLKVQLDDVSDRDACCLGLCVMPALTHLTLESNASAIGVTGAAGLAPLTSLRELVLPSQALGDQGLQFICDALLNLEALNVHNDGHVTDDGMAALASLTALTALDLQGNVSITQAAMPTLAAAAPRLRKLNLAWLAMVNDWGLGQLSCLTDLQELDLRATGVELKTATATAALSNLTTLTRLDMSRCRLEPVAIHALATFTPYLQNLSLASTTRSKSFTELQPLQQLSSLTKLDLSLNLLGPADADHIVVCGMTQLRHLVLNCVIMDRSMSDLLKGWLRIDAPKAAAAKEKGEEESTAETPGPEAQDLAVQAVDDIISRELLAAAAPIAESLRQAAAVSPHVQLPMGGSGAIASSSRQQLLPPATAAAPNSGGVQTPWAQFLMSLAKLQHLTALDFADNGSCWALERSSFDRARPPLPEMASTLKARLIEPALLLLGFAAARHTALRSLHFVSPERMPQHDTVRVHTTGEMQGQWTVALKMVAGTILTALGDSMQQEGLVCAVQQKGAELTAGQQQHHQQQQQQQLEKLVGSLRVEGAVGGVLTVDSTAPHATLSSRSAEQHVAGGSSGCGLSDAAQQRMLVLVRKLQDAQQQRQQQEEVEAPRDAAGWLKRLERLKASFEHVYLSLGEGEAAEVLQLLLPGLHNLYFAW